MQRLSALAIDKQHVTVLGPDATACSIVTKDLREMKRAVEKEGALE
jgi:ribulose kinase